MIKIKDNPPIAESSLKSASEKVIIEFKYKGNDIFLKDPPIEIVKVLKVLQNGRNTSMYIKYDSKFKGFRILPSFFFVLEYILKEIGIFRKFVVKYNFNRNFSIKKRLISKFQLRDYQLEALESLRVEKSKYYNDILGNLSPEIDKLKEEFNVQENQSIDDNNNKNNNETGSAWKSADEVLRSKYSEASGDILDKLDQEGISFEMDGFDEELLDDDLSDNWEDAFLKGIVILPTGSGKTFVGLAAIALMNIKTLIVVPTIELVDQWFKRLKQLISIERKNGNTNSNMKSPSSNEDKKEYFGRFMGSIKELAPITITTYNSAFLNLRTFSDKFGLVIFDEVHHLAGEKFINIAKGLLAPNKIGLTATLNKQEEIYPIIANEIGQIVYNKTPKELSDANVLAKYEEKRVFVPLTDEELKEYRKYMQIYQTILQTFYPGYKRGGLSAFKNLIYRSNSNINAKKALLAFQKARNIAFNSWGKLAALQNILKAHSNSNEDERIIIFSENISFVELISRTFLIPALTSNTSNNERKTILRKFREGVYRILATGKVLDEGIDVPEASVGIIISGTSVPRQYIQRLGRILRPKVNKKAFLYEVISKMTKETKISYRRRRGRK